MTMQYQCNDLILLFNKLFKNSEKTILVKGGAEPLYQPVNKGCAFNQIIFTQDYYASALHEIAHWCIVGEARRKLADYGYWYKADGRSKDEQILFEEVEIKPQALEWIFSVAAGSKFNASADNLDGDISISTNFKLRLYSQVIDYLDSGLPDRAEKFKRKLLQFYQRAAIFDHSLFLLIN